MRKLIVLMLLIAGMCIAGIAPEVLASPAPPDPVDVEQPDGTAITVRVFGDEFGMFVETLEGYTIVRDTRGYWNYGVRGQKGKIVPSGVLIGENPALLGIGKHLRHSDEEMEKIDRRRKEFNGNRRIFRPLLERKKIKERLDSGTASSAPGGASSGPETASAALAPTSYHLAVLLIEFPVGTTPPYYSSPVLHTYEPQVISDLLFSVNSFYTTPLGAPAYGSMRDYFHAVSYGQFELTGEVFPWVQADYADDYYHEEPGGGALLREEAIAKSGVDLSRFDGYAVVYAGRSHLNGWLWPHATIGGPWYMTSESFNSGDDISILGVHAHEFGHVLGLPDLYDGDGTIGAWGIMGTGQYLQGPSGILNDRCPSQMISWSKTELGWVTPTVLAEGVFPGLTIGALDQVPEVYKVISERSYFLIANRQRVGYDRYLLGEGMMIFHYNPTGEGWTTGATWKIDLEEADGIPLNVDQSLASYAGDPFPGSTGTSAFTCVSAPAASLDIDGGCSVALTNIASAGRIVSFDALVDWPAAGVGISIDGTGDYPTILTAIESASPGQTVSVPAGTFTETIDMRGGVNVRGAGAGATIVQFAGVSPLVNGADDSTLSGFTFQGDDSMAVRAYLAPQNAGGQVVVANNAFRDWSIALDMSPWNTLYSTSHGNLRIVNNVFDSGHYAVYGQTDDNPVVENNIFYQNAYGVFQYGGGATAIWIDFNSYSGNTSDNLGMPKSNIGRNNITRKDPLFTDLAAGDYSLQPGSPCIDAGNPDPFFADIDGSRNDIGAFGGPLTPNAAAPALEAGVQSIQTGFYETTGKGNNQTTTFVPANTFTAGAEVVFLLSVVDSVSGLPVAGAVVDIAITGPETASLTSGPLDGAGIAEARWQTSAPNRKGSGGTIPGAYTAVTTGISGSGVTWDGIMTEAVFTIN